MKEQKTKIKTYGIIIGIIMLALQHGIYLLANDIAGLVGINPFLPKIFIDYQIPILPVFIVPYVWAYIYWAMGPMAVSKCDTKYFLDFLATYIFTCLMGAVILIFAPTYMDRVAEGLTDTSRTGFFAALMRFWYTLDGGDMAFNLLPSFHCINSTVCLLGVWNRKEISAFYRIYSLIITVLIYFSTVFVKQHFVLDVVTGVLLSVICFYIGMKFNFGKIFYRFTVNRKNK